MPVVHIYIYIRMASRVYTYIDRQAFDGFFFYRSHNIATSLVQRLYSSICSSAERKRGPGIAFSIGARAFI